MQIQKARIVLIVLFIISLVSCSTRKTIAHGLDIRDANEIIVFLSNHGIMATKVKSEENKNSQGIQKVTLWDITVDSDIAQESLSLLNANGLPRRKEQNLLEIFSSGGLVPSDMQEKIRYETGLGQQIASTIRKIDGVIEAEVNLSFPREDPLDPKAPKKEATAAVYVKHTGVFDDPNMHLDTKVKRLVSSAVNDLSFDNVTVISDRARFADPNLVNPAKKREDQDLIQVWSLVIAKQSLTHFQMLFFCMSTSLFLLFLTIGVLIWKIFPLVQKCGGFRTFFTSNLQEIHFEKMQDKTKPARLKEEQENLPEFKIQQNVES